MHTCDLNAMPGNYSEEVLQTCPGLSFNKQVDVVSLNRGLIDLHLKSDRDFLNKI